MCKTENYKILDWVQERAMTMDGKTHSYKDIDSSWADLQIHASKFHHIFWCKLAN